MGRGASIWEKKKFPAPEEKYQVGLGGEGGFGEKAQSRMLGAKAPPLYQELPAQAHLGGGCLTICWGHPSGNP